MSQRHLQMKTRQTNSEAKHLTTYSIRSRICKSTHSMSLCLYVTGTAMVQIFICTGTVGTVGTLVPATLCLCAYMYWYCGYCWYTSTSHSMSLYQYVTGTALVLLFICTGTVGTVGTLVLATLCLCTNMLLVPHWYCSLYILVLWVLLVHWYQPLYVSVPICYWYCTGTALYMYWYCGYWLDIGTSHSMSLYQYVTGTALVLLFICTDTVGTVHTVILATLCFCTNMLLVLHWCCTLYVLVLWVLLVHWYQPLYVSVPTCHWYHTGTALYMHWYCGYGRYCWYTGTSHSMSLYQYVTGTTLVLLFICTGTVGTVGTLVLATLCLCTNMLLVLLFVCTGTVGTVGTLVPATLMSVYQYVTGTALVLLFICTGTVGTVGTLVPTTLCLCTNILLELHWYCFLYVLVLWVLLVHWYQPLLCLCTNMLLVLHWYCSLYVLVLWVQLVHWYQPLYVSVPIFYWNYTGTAFYMYWYCGYCWYIGTSHSMSLCLYVTGGTLVLPFICTGTVGSVGTLVPATLCLCTNMLLVPHWYCSLYVLVLWVLLGHWYQPLYVSVPICYWYCTGTALYMYWHCGYCW